MTEVGAGRAEVGAGRAEVGAGGVGARGLCMGEGGAEAG